MTLIRQTEVEDILEGDDEKFKMSPTESNSTAVSAPPKPSRTNRSSTANWTPQLPTTSHLDAVALSTPIIRPRSTARKTKSFPALYVLQPLLVKC